MEEVDLAIVGAGPTGLFATFCAGLRLINSVTLDGLDTYGGQMMELYPEKIVYDVLGVPKMRATDLAKKMYEQAQTFKGKIIFNSNVTDIIPSDDHRFTVEVDKENKYSARSVLICAGVGYFEPKKLGIPEEDDYAGKGVYYTVKTIDDFKDKNVLIVGGGDSAFDYCMQIEPVVKSVAIAQHNNNVKAAESSVQTVESSKKAKILLNTDIIGITGDGNRITSVKTKDNSTNSENELAVDSIIVAIGHKAIPDIFKSLNLETDGRYIKVDTNYKTNVDGVYAAGDIANVSDEPKFALIAVGAAEAYLAINNIKKYLTPSASLFGGHSSSLQI